MVRYNTIVQVLISFKFKNNFGVDLDQVKLDTETLAKKLFPDKNEVSPVFRLLMYGETHQTTWDISGAFNMTHDQVMESNSELEAMQKHFGKVLSKHFGKYDAEYKVYACGYNEPVLECVWDSNGN